MRTDSISLKENDTGQATVHATMPQCLASNLCLAKYEHGRFVSDAYFSMSKAERDHVDEWLVAIQHPSVFQPGTQEARISAAIREFGA